MQFCISCLIRCATRKNARGSAYAEFFAGYCDLCGTASFGSLRHSILCDQHQVWKTKTLSQKTVRETTSHFSVCCIFGYVATFVGWFFAFKEYSATKQPSWACETLFLLLKRITKWKLVWHKLSDCENMTARQ